MPDLLLDLNEGDIPGIYSHKTNTQTPPVSSVCDTNHATYQFQSGPVFLKWLQGATKLAYERVFTTQQNVRLPSLNVVFIFIVRVTK